MWRCPVGVHAQRIFYEFVTKLVARSKSPKLGNGCHEGVQIGPLIDASAVQKVEAHVRDAIIHGGRVLRGGRSLSGLGHEPTVIADASAAILIAREETFEPVAAVIRFDTEEEVVAAANDTEFGLASYFYSRSLPRGIRVSEALEYGMVGINTGLISNEVARRQTIWARTRRIPPRDRSRKSAARMPYHWVARLAASACRERNPSGACSRIGRPLRNC